MDTFGCFGRQRRPKHPKCPFLCKQWFVLGGCLDQALLLFGRHGREIGAGLEHQRQDRDIAGCAKPGHILRKREVDRLLDHFLVTERFIPGCVRVLTIVPRAAGDGLDDHGAHVFPPALA